MLTASELKVLLRVHRVRLTKRLGQHHLVDARAVQRLVDTFHLSRQDTVIEIGAGLGALTEALAQRAGSVLAVEVDRKISALLAQRMAVFDNVTVVHQDILAFPWQRHRDVVVVGAIPYHITSPILIALARARRRIRSAWLLVQDALAQRLLAQPGTKAYGRLSVLARYCWDVAQVCRVPRAAFFPQPTVDSACLLLRPHPTAPLTVADESDFFAFVQRVFAHRRKTLVNSLADGGAAGRERVQAALRTMGLPPMVRGEQLSLEQLGTLYREAIVCPRRFFY